MDDCIVLFFFIFLFLVVVDGKIYLVNFVYFVFYKFIYIELFICYLEYSVVKGEGSEGKNLL